MRCLLLLAFPLAVFTVDARAQEVPTQRAELLREIEAVNAAQRKHSGEQRAARKAGLAKQRKRAAAHAVSRTKLVTKQAELYRAVADLRWTERVARVDQLLELSRLQKQLRTPSTSEDPAGEALKVLRALLKEVQDANAGMIEALEGQETQLAAASAASHTDREYRASRLLEAREQFEIADEERARLAEELAQRENREREARRLAEATTPEETAYLRDEQIKDQIKDLQRALRDARDAADSSKNRWSEEESRRLDDEITQEQRQDLELRRLSDRIEDLEQEEGKLDRDREQIGNRLGERIAALEERLRKERTAGWEAEKAAQTLEQKLDTRTMNVTFRRAPIADAVDFLTQVTALPFVTRGLKGDEVVLISSGDHPVRAILDLILRNAYDAELNPVELTWAIEDAQIVISRKE